MYISRVQIRNFRNFHNLDVSLGQHAVIVGENKIGKSNFIFALRLILDPSLSESARQLCLEDFWDGLDRPLARDDKIEISIELSDFENNECLLGILGQHLVQPAPMVSRITYVHQTKASVEGQPSKDADYEYLIYGGDREENTVGHYLRRRIPFDLLHALRDAVNDLARWKKSPLKPLLVDAASQIEHDIKEEAADNITQATEEVGEIGEISSLADTINSKLIDIVGEQQAIDTKLSHFPTTAEKLFRSLRVFIDGGERSISEASLGSANLLYLTLKLLTLKLYVEQDERDYTFLAIEEPEAHLYPHLQRLVYRYSLKARLDGETAETETANLKSILLTTHSPQIVSVAPLKTLVILRKADSEDSTIAVSAADVDLDEKDIEDLERYIDVNRGEILFARAVLLVEGDAERFIVPALAQAQGYDFDKLGITVCSVAGTNFVPYIRLLSSEALGIPYAVITDMDPKAEDDEERSLGEKRIIYQCMQSVLPDDEWEALKYEEDILAKAPDHGFFLNDYTLEVDLIKSGWYSEFHEAMSSLSDNNAAIARSKLFSEDNDALDAEQLLKDIKEVGKGRFAQRMASIILKTGKKITPSYITDAIRYLISKLGD